MFDGGRKEEKKLHSYANDFLLDKNISDVWAIISRNSDFF